MRKPEPIVTANDKQLSCLALNMYHEARGEGDKGMLLVGHTTVNRVLSSRYPDTICGVVYQKHQFSWTKNPDTVSESNLYDRAKQLAEQIVYRDADPSKGSIYFFNHNVVIPAWASRKTTTLVYKNHKYMR